MEQADNQVWLLVLLHVSDPFAGTGRHLLELHALPYLLVQPTGNSGRQHADDAYLHTVLYMDAVRFHAVIDVGRISLAVLASLLHDVGAYHRTAHLTNPFVVHLVSGFHVMVAEGLYIVLHVVDHPGGQVLLVRRYEVCPVRAGLALQNVAVVYQQQVLAIFLPLPVDECIGTCQ